MKRSRFFATSGTLLAIVALIVLGFFVPVFRRSIYVCETTGSARVRTTWFGVLKYEKYLESPLENYLRLKHPDILDHRWVWIGATEKTLFGRTILWEDTFSSASAVNWLVRSDVFRDLPEETKLQLYHTLAQCSRELPADEKKRVYRALLDIVDERDVGRFIRDNLPDGIPDTVPIMAQ